QKLDYVALLESVLTGQYLFDGVRVINAITQLRPVLIVIDPYDYRPALAIVAPLNLILDLIWGRGLSGLRALRVRGAGSRAGLYGKRSRNEPVSVEYHEGVALFTELFEDSWQCGGALHVNIVHQQHALLRHFDLGQNSLDDRFRDRVRPIHGVERP